MLEEKQSIMKVAKKLKMKYSRAKFVIKTYKETGKMILPVKEKAIKLEYHDSLEGNQEAVLDHLSSDSPIPPRENSALAMGEPPMMNNQENMVFFLYPFLQWPPF